jgi:glycosyltransferase involved in cell wall biosynthesis
VIGVHVVLPGVVDDPAAPSGGNTYDRRICEGLSAAGRPVRRIAVPGAWPRPRPEDRRALSAALATIPDGAAALLDGLVACGVPDVLLPHASRLRLVVLVHLPLADETGLHPDDAAELDTAERRTLQVAVAVVSTSAAVGCHLVQHHGLPAARVHVAPPGVDPAPLTAGTDGGRRLLCVASVTPRKGHDVLVKALSRLADRPWSCDCAGPLDGASDHVALVRRLLIQHGLENRVRLVGPRTGDDLAALYATADLLVLPSRAEPYGMVITEALARGVPVLATAVDGVPEALGRARDGGLPGMLVPPGDPAALADALRRWLDEPDLRNRLRTAAGERRATLGGWEETTSVLAEVLDRVGNPA